jgi:ribonuclease HII
VLAMRRALTRLTQRPHHVLIDGKPIRTLGIEHTAIVGGDDACYSIACASIVAKVTRDRLMHALAPRYPNYRWDTNVGYATAAHLEGLGAVGLTPHHRRSFVPVRQLSLDFGGLADLSTDQANRVEVDVAALAILVDADLDTSSAELR